MPKLTPQQRIYIRKRTKEQDLDPSEAAGELNIIPFLDVTVNLIMFLLIISSAIAFFSQINVTLPNIATRGSRGGDPEAQLNLTVTVVENGVMVAGSNGRLAPNCNEIATHAGVTVPQRDGQYDWDALTRCAQRVKDTFPEEKTVTVSADPRIHYRFLVRAMDAVRNNGSVELFPEVLISAGVREGG